jgi:hypothetical protein
MLISTCADEDVNDEPLTLVVACELITNTLQSAGIVVFQWKEKFTNWVYNQGE